MKTILNPYSGYRYPTEIISHAVWLYFRFSLSFRDIEELLAARGIVVTYGKKHRVRFSLKALAWISTKAGCPNKH